MSDEKNYGDEYYFRFNELKVDNPKVGDFGEISFKCEITSVDKEGVCLRKHGEVNVTKPFKDMDLQEMKKRVGEVEDPEMPMKKEY